MFAKSVIQAWLGAALTQRVPSAVVSGGGRSVEPWLFSGDPPGVMKALFECVGSVPMIRFARTSRINKEQAFAYATEDVFQPWQKRMFYVLGHPDETLGPPSLSGAGDHLRFIGLADVKLHVGRTGRGTINSDLLESLTHEPSTFHPYSIATTVDQMLDLVQRSAFVPPQLWTGPADREWVLRSRFGWISRPAPVCAELRDL